MIDARYEREREDALRAMARRCGLCLICSSRDVEGGRVDSSLGL